MIEQLLFSKPATVFGGGPGPTTLSAGDKNNGLFGVVAAADFFTGSQLAAACGATQGTLINDATTWFKLCKDGKVIYMPQKAIRTGLTWNMIETLGMRLPSQNKIITKGDKQYRVRNIQGTGAAWANNTGDDPAGCSDSEFNRFIYRLCGLTAPSETPPVLGNYSLADLGMRLADNGCCFICQEGNTSGYVQRNGGGEATANGTSWNSLQQGVNSNLADQYRGWRPVLELVN